MECVVSAHNVIIKFNYPNYFIVNLAENDVEIVFIRKFPGIFEGRPFILLLSCIFFHFFFFHISINYLTTTTTTKLGTKFPIMPELYGTLLQNSYFKITTSLYFVYYLVEKKY